jgi:ferredoxin--NADP+ reductase
VIGTNKKDAQETVNHLLADVASGRLLEPAEPGPEAIENLLAERKAHFVSFSGWEKIDHAEVTAGEPHERPRVKFVQVDQMLEVASGAGADTAESGGEATAEGKD